MDIFVSLVNVPVFAVKKVQQLNRHQSSLKLHFTHRVQICYSDPLAQKFADILSVAHAMVQNRSNRLL